MFKRIASATVLCILFPLGHYFKKLSCHCLTAKDIHLHVYTCKCMYTHAYKNICVYIYIWRCKCTHISTSSFLNRNDIQTLLISLWAKLTHTQWVVFLSAVTWSICSLCWVSLSVFKKVGIFALMVMFILVPHLILLLSPSRCCLWVPHYAWD